MLRKNESYNKTLSTALSLPALLILPFRDGAQRQRSELNALPEFLCPCHWQFLLIIKARHENRTAAALLQPHLSAFKVKAMTPASDIACGKFSFLRLVMIRILRRRRFILLFLAEDALPYSADEKHNEHSRHKHEHPHTGKADNQFLKEYAGVTQTI